MTEDKKIVSGVFYTDGGCSPNPGFMGMGCHGYIFEDVESKVPSKFNGELLTDKGYLTVRSNDYKQIKPLKFIDYVGQSQEQGTNNRAELLSVLNVLKSVDELFNKYNFDIKKVLVITDSEYVNKGINYWLKEWEANGWVNSNGLAIANKKIWMEISKELLPSKELGYEFKIEWVKGHSNNLGNRIADLLASIGINYSQKNIIPKNITLYSPKEYTKVEIKRHPLVSFNRLYFNTTKEYNKNGVLYQANPGSNELFIGKRIADTSYSVIKLANDEDVISDLIEEQISACDGNIGIHVMKLDKVYNRDIYKYIKRYRKMALKKTRPNNNITFVNKEQLTTEFLPTGLSLRAIDKFNLLEEFLEKYILYKKDNTSLSKDVYNTDIIDVTDNFFIELTTLKTTLKKEILAMKLKSISIILKRDKPITIPVVFGLDIPSHNNLRKIENENPKVFLYTWSESKDSFRYSFIIDCNLGVGIWSNTFSNKIFK